VFSVRFFFGGSQYSGHLFSPAVRLEYILEHSREITVKIVCITIRTNGREGRAMTDPIQTLCAKITKNRTDGGPRLWLVCEEEAMNSVNNAEDTNKKPVVCAIYTRVSTDKQAMQGLSLGQQEAIDSLGVLLDASYGLLLNLFPNLPAGAERQPSKKRKAFRGKRARV